MTTTRRDTWPKRSGGDSPRRISTPHLVELHRIMSPRANLILRLLDQHRFLTSRHVAALVFADAITDLASARAASRAMNRLESQGLVAKLARPIGGLRGGSMAATWHLSEAGFRLLQIGEPEGKARRRFSEPSQTFLRHTLAVADIRVGLEQVANTDLIELVDIQTEPNCWRDWVGSHGKQLTLRPDLFAETAVGDYLDAWFIECDLDTEHLPAIVRKARVYETYRTSGREQAASGVFPLVLWITTDHRRAKAILAAIAADPRCDENIHRAATFDSFTTAITNATDATSALTGAATKGEPMNQPDPNDPAITGA